MKFQTKETKEQFTPQTKKVIRYTIATIVLLFILYFSYQLIMLFKPPTITLLEPQKTTFTVEKKVLLKGKTEKDTIITVNDERIYLDDNNMFSTEIPLTKEKNYVSIKATGANGRKSELDKVLIRQFEDQP